jgi:predicted transcriptional regulator of viral defense system
MAKIKSYNALSNWVDKRQSLGLYYFINKDAVKSLGISEMAFLQSAKRLALKNRIVRIFSGFYIIVPLEYSITELIPPEWFIKDLMDYMEKSFYVGLLSAARLHGASHQQPQIFQVLTSTKLRKIKVKSTAIQFYYKKNFKSTSLELVKTQTGFIPVSTPEATAYDLIRYSRRIGGLDRAQTVLIELTEKMDSKKLVENAAKEQNMANIQRLGWLLEESGFKDLAKDLRKWVSQKNPVPARLVPSLPIKGAKREKKWNLLINASVEGDL